MSSTRSWLPGRAGAVRIHLAVTAIAVALVATGCSKPPEYPSIEVGECAGSMAEGVVVQVEKVKCNQPHDWEAFASKSVPDAEEFPGAEELEQMTESFCSEEFEAFVGVELDDSELEVQYLIPTKLSWEIGDRMIVCMAGSDDLQITETLKGSKR